ncbi:MAG: PrgI family protein, partial [Clostridium sp.]|nr:PrgI family protein [Clostridium sp.]
SLNNTDKKKKSKKGADVEPLDNAKNQEEFEAMKRKTKNILLGMIAVIIAAVAGIAIFKATR